jgi:hypothetical protein
VQSPRFIAEGEAVGILGDREQSCSSIGPLSLSRRMVTELERGTPPMAQ